VINYKEALGIVIVSAIAAVSSIFELFKLGSIIGSIFTVVSASYLPAFVLAIFITQRADPPGQIGIIVAALVQTYIIYILFRFIRVKYFASQQNT
jgi:hypothetical protein